MSKGYLPDKTAQERLRQVQERRKAQADKDLAALMRLPEGRRFVFRLLDEVCGVFSETFTGSSDTFHREGKRSVGIEVMQHAQVVAPREWVKALTEAYALRNEEQIHEQAAIAQAEGKTDGR